MHITVYGLTVTDGQLLFTIRQSCDLNQFRRLLFNLQYIRMYFVYRLRRTEKMRDAWRKKLSFFPASVCEKSDVSIIKVVGARRREGAS